MPHRRYVLLTITAVACLTARGQAHFVWLVVEPQERANTVKLYFAEAPEPDDPELLDRVADAEVFALSGWNLEPQSLTLRREGDDLMADVPESLAHAPIVLRHTYGLFTRGDDPFLLKYYAKAYPSALPGNWRTVSDADVLPLEVVPSLDRSSVAFQVLWRGRPVEGATVTVSGPEFAGAEGETDESGRFACPLGTGGLYSVRARFIQESPGEYEGEAYSAVRHYSTVTFPYEAARLFAADHAWPELERGTTSFGAAVIDDWLYVYGGHYGGAHHYSREGQSGDFLRLNLRDPEQWESLPGGPKLTGLAMVAHGGMLYRVGGFTAENNDNEDQNLWSQSGFARFDPEQNSWADLPSLPERRSSLDAAVVGDTLYVVGGWDMQGGDETAWHDTAWSVDLTAEELRWQQLATPPFHRRALALAAWEDRLYVIGGMREDGNSTTRVAVYDPAKQEWSEGPGLLGRGMDGFGSSSFACNGRLFATTMSGSMQRLSEDGEDWEFVGQLEHPRFFHRLLPWQGSDLVLVGGADMTSGKIVELERVPVADGGADADR